MPDNGPWFSTNTLFSWFINKKKNIKEKQSFNEITKQYIT